MRGYQAYSNLETLLAILCLEGKSRVRSGYQEDSKGEFYYSLRWEVKTALVL